MASNEIRQTLGSAISRHGQFLDDANLCRQIKPAASSQIPQPTMISISAVDRYGNISPPAAFRKPRRRRHGHRHLRHRRRSRRRESTGWANKSFTIAAGGTSSMTISDFFEMGLVELVPPNEIENGFGRAVSRILSAPCERRESFVWAADTRNPSAFAELERAAPGFPIWPCTRWGFPCRVACASRGGLLHHLFTLAGALAKRRRYHFLWHCPSESLSTFRPRVSQSNGLGLRGIAPFGVRTFLFRLAPKAILRPSKTNVKLTET